jgi:catechol 2,3-dioxygenase-like lactoylglutathione lyase family enzyme
VKRTLDAQTVIRPAKFAHFVLRVRNLEESIAWYQTVLGMEVVHHAGKLAFLTYDDEHHRLALA